MGNIFSYLLGEETTAMEASPIFIHLDLNKTILAVDEVKLYGREEVIFLEHWKNEADFLEWAHATHGGDAEAAAWTADLKVSKNEPTLIGYAKEYCNLDAGRKDMMENQLSNVRTDDSTESFWKLVEYLKSPEGLADRKGRECLLVFRTFGTDLMKMFNRVDANGHSSSVLKETNANPKIFTMVHEASDAYKAICTPKDLTDGFIQPGNPVPGPKAKGGLVNGFLYPFMVNEIKASNTLAGLSLTLNFMSEFVMFAFSKYFLENLNGPTNCIIVGSVSFFIRFLCMSYAYNVYLVMALQMFHAFGFALYWAAAVETVNLFSPKESLMTMMSILTTTQFGIGDLIANVGGGLLYDRFNGRLMFRYISFIFAGLAVLLILVETIKKRCKSRCVKRKSMQNQEPTVEITHF